MGGVETLVLEWYMMIYTQKIEIWKSSYQNCRFNRQVCLVGYAQCSVPEELSNNHQMIRNMHGICDFKFHNSLLIRSPVWTDEITIAYTANKVTSENIRWNILYIELL